MHNNHESLLTGSTAADYRVTRFLGPMDTTVGSILPVSDNSRGTTPPPPYKNGRLSKALTLCRCWLGECCGKYRSHVDYSGLITPASRKPGHALHDANLHVAISYWFPPAAQRPRPLIMYAPGRYTASHACVPLIGRYIQFNVTTLACRATCIQVSVARFSRKIATCCCPLCPLHTRVRPEELIANENMTSPKISAFSTTTLQSKYRTSSSCRAL